MELQQASIEKSIPNHFHAIPKVTEATEPGHKAGPLLVELNEREEFVKRIEAFCDCV